MEKIKNACQLIAEHIRKVEIEEDLYQEMKFIRADVIDYLLCQVNQDEFFDDFYNDADLYKKQGVSK